MPPRQQSRVSKGFSLIELLVAIAVIGILVSLLIASIGSVRRKADQSKCASNLRSLAMASMSFGNDHGGLIVPWRYYPVAGGELVYWEKSLSGYLDIPRSASRNAVPASSILLCPTEMENTHGETSYYEAGYHTRYAINIHIAWNAVGNPTGDSGNPNYQAGYYQKLEYPGRTFLFIDFFGPEAGAFWMGPYLTYPHGGRVNVAHADGHVESHDRQKMQAYFNDRSHVFWRGYAQPGIDLTIH